MFGVFTIKERRFQLKDITSNVTHSFDADSFIQALGWFLLDVEASEHSTLTIVPTLLDQRKNCGKHSLSANTRPIILWVQKVHIEST